MRRRAIVDICHVQWLPQEREEEEEEEEEVDTELTKRPNGSRQLLFVVKTIAYCSVLHSALCYVCKYSKLVV